VSEDKARAAAKFRRPTKALAVQKLDFKYLLSLRRPQRSAFVCNRDLIQRLGR